MRVTHRVVVTVKVDVAKVLLALAVWASLLM